MLVGYIFFFILCSVRDFRTLFWIITNLWLSIWNLLTVSEVKLGWTRNCDGPQCVLLELLDNRTSRWFAGSEVWWLSCIGFWCFIGRTAELRFPISLQSTLWSGCSSQSHPRTCSGMKLKVTIFIKYEHWFINFTAIAYLLMYSVSIFKC